MAIWPPPRLQHRQSLETGANPNFIGCCQKVDPGTYQAFIDYFEAHPYLQSAGWSGIGDVDDAIKKSTNIQVEPTIMENEAYPFLTD